MLVVMLVVLIALGVAFWIACGIWAIRRCDTYWRERGADVQGWEQIALLGGPVIALCDMLAHPRHYRTKT